MTKAIRDKKLGRITGRISGELRARLDAINEKHGTNDTRLAADVMSALADFVEAQGHYVRPMRMVSAKLSAEYGVNEDAPGETRGRIEELLQRVEAELKARREESERARGG